MNYEKLSKIIKMKIYLSIQIIIIHLANYYNYKNSLVNKNVLIVLKRNLNYINEELIKNITLKYYKNINYLNSLENIQLSYLIRIIQSRQLILKDNPYIFELAAIFLTYIPFNLFNFIKE